MKSLTDLAVLTAGMSLHKITPAFCHQKARELIREGKMTDAYELLRLAGSPAEPWKSPNQRQRRKHRRQRWAAGDRRAFAA